MIIEDFPIGARDLGEYLRIKANVDILKIIQLGITISDGHGRMPSPISTWQFNFNFNLECEPKANASI